MFPLLAFWLNETATDVIVSTNLKHLQQLPWVFQTMTQACLTGFEIDLNACSLIYVIGREQELAEWASEWRDDILSRIEQWEAAIRRYLLACLYIYDDNSNSSPTSNPNWQYLNSSDVGMWHHTEIRTVLGPLLFILYTADVLKTGRIMVSAFTLMQMICRHMPAVLQLTSRWQPLSST